MTMNTPTAVNRRASVEASMRARGRIIGRLDAVQASSQSVSLLTGPGIGRCFDEGVGTHVEDVRANQLQVGVEVDLGPLVLRHLDCANWSSLIDDCLDGGKV